MKAKQPTKEEANMMIELTDGIEVFETRSIEPDIDLLMEMKAHAERETGGNITWRPIYEWLPVHVKTVRP